MTVRSFEAAKKICSLSNWAVTNLKLQKILYFVNLVHLGRSREPLVDEQFEAWDYGPVLPSVYHHLKLFGIDPIKDRFYETSIIQDTEEAKILEEAWRSLKNKQGWELVGMTHVKNGAWAKNYIPQRNITISNDDILEEYNKRYGQ